MSLRPLARIELPPNSKEGGFDHAAVHDRSGRLYVAHTSNDALDVVDSASDRFLRSIPGLKGVAGVLVSDERDLLFTANRAENTVGIFDARSEGRLRTVRVGIRPNGLAFDPSRGLLLVANVGDPSVPRSSTVSLVDVNRKAVIGTVVLPGRPRWGVFDESKAAFLLNIADPPRIALLDAENPGETMGSWEIPARGPHGMDIDSHARQVFCACDEGKIVTVALDSGEVRSVRDLSGPPDVVFFNPRLGHVYVAIGGRGVIDVFDAKDMQILERVRTEEGAHTIAINRQNKLYAFLPSNHQAAVYQDEQD
jgi:DNA-binding beta-propeller fold protein YncE